MRVVARFALLMNISIDESMHRSDAISRHSRAIKARLMAFLPGLASAALLFGRPTTIGRWKIMRNVWPVAATRIRRRDQTSAYRIQKLEYIEGRKNKGTRDEARNPYATLVAFN